MVALTVKQETLVERLGVRTAEAAYPHEEDGSVYVQFGILASFVKELIVVRIEIA